MNTQHTPGEWKVNYQLDGSIFIDTEKRDIAMMQGEEQMTPEDDANARLIAAAPLLLQALHDLIKTVETGTSNLIGWDEADTVDTAIDKAKAAIQKAIK